MADIKKVILLNGQEYDLKDARIPSAVAADEDKVIRVDENGNFILGAGGSLTVDDYLTAAEIEEIIGSEIIWDGTIE